MAASNVKIKQDNKKLKEDNLTIYEMVEVNNITRAIQSNRINYLEGLIAYAGIDLDALYYIDFVDAAYEKYEETMRLVFRGCKGTFFLMYLFALPLMIEMPYVLQLWLKEPPELSVLFTRLALLDALIDHRLHFLQIDTLAGGNEKTVVLQLGHPGAHQFFKCQVFFCSGGKVVSRLLDIRVSVYLVKYEYHWLSSSADVGQCFVYYIYLLLKVGMRNIYHVKQ